jgi:hypothetical protein
MDILCKIELKDGRLQLLKLTKDQIIDFKNLVNKYEPFKLSLIGFSKIYSFNVISNSSEMIPLGPNLYNELLEKLNILDQIVLEICINFLKGQVSDNLKFQVLHKSCFEQSCVEKLKKNSDYNYSYYYYDCDTYNIEDIPLFANGIDKSIICNKYICDQLYERGKIDKKLLTESLTNFCPENIDENTDMSIVLRNLKCWEYSTSFGDSERFNKFLPIETVLRYVNKGNFPVNERPDTGIVCRENPSVGFNEIDVIKRNIKMLINKVFKTNCFRYCYKNYYLCGSLLVKQVVNNSDKYEKYYKNSDLDIAIVAPTTYMFDLFYKKLILDIKYDIVKWEKVESGTSHKYKVKLDNGIILDIFHAKTDIHTLISTFHIPQVRMCYDLVNEKLLLTSSCIESMILGYGETYRFYINKEPDVTFEKNLSILKKYIDRGFAFRLMNCDIDILHENSII